MMRKITDEEIGELSLVKSSVKGTNPAVLFAKMLTNGESMLLPRTNWRYKSPPSALINGSLKKLGRRYQVRSLSSGEGWLVTRVR